MEVVVLYNEPSLAADDPDAAAEAEVLESVDFVSEALASGGHAVRRLGVPSAPAELAETLARLGDADVVFNLFEGLGGVSRGEAEVAGLVEMLGYSLTGSPADCLALVRHKARAKWLLAGAGLPTAEFTLVDSHGPLHQEQLRALLRGGALIVKPAHEDASLGIDENSIVDSWGALVRQIERVRARYGATLVERFIAGREFNAAVVALGEPQLLPLSEIEFTSREAGPSAQIVSYEAKWASGSAADRATPSRCPARVDAATIERVRQVSIAAFRLMGCRDYARVDLRMDDQGRLYILEINGNPDIGPSAGFVPTLRAAGWTYEEFVERLVQQAARRHGGMTAQLRTS